MSESRKIHLIGTNDRTVCGNTITAKYGTSSLITDITCDRCIHRYGVEHYTIAVRDLQISKLENRLDKAVETLKYFDEVHRKNYAIDFNDLEAKAFETLKELGVENE